MKKNKDERIAAVIARLEFWIAENSTHIEKIESGEGIIFYDRPEAAAAHLASVRQKNDEWRQLIEKYRSRIGTETD